MAAFNNYKDRPLPVFRNLINYTMFAPAIEEGGKQARLTVSFMDYRPRISLFTNVSTDDNKGMVSVGYYPDIFQTILDTWEKACDLEPGKVIPIKNFKDIRTDEGKRTGERVVDSVLNFGKDEAGVMYIQLIAQGRTKIKFFFKLSDYHQIFKEDKTPLTEEEASIFVAKGWIKGIRAAVNQHCSQLAPEQAASTGGKPSGISKPAPATSNSNMLDFDDDIPM